jgi:bifunctional non-homologous end joining protein LigD
MPDWLDRLDSSERQAVSRNPPPGGSSAMRATLTMERFSDAQWIFERKLDGIRCVAVRASGGSVRLGSRNNLSLDDRYPGGCVTRGFSGCATTSQLKK